jgi:chromosome segregation ATPase
MGQSPKNYSTTISAKIRALEKERTELKSSIEASETRLEEVKLLLKKWRMHEKKMQMLTEDIDQTIQDENTKKSPETAQSIPEMKDEAVL